MWALQVRLHVLNLCFSMLLREDLSFFVSCIEPPQVSAFVLLSIVPHRHTDGAGCRG